MNRDNGLSRILSNLADNPWQILQKILKSETTKCSQ